MYKVHQEGTSFWIVDGTMAVSDPRRPVAHVMFPHGKEMADRIAKYMNAYDKLVEACRGPSTEWGKDLAELLEFVAHRRDVDAKQEDATECVSPKLREAAKLIREALEGVK